MQFECTRLYVWVYLEVEVSNFFLSFSTGLITTYGKRVGGFPANPTLPPGQQERENRDADDGEQ